MPKPKRALEHLISYRFAATMIAVLFGASAAGWIATELVPADFLDKAEGYRAAWGGLAAKIVLLLRLYDPFHSFWYRFVLALFFVVLLVCVATRWRRLAFRSWRSDLPSSAEELRKEMLSLEFSWRLLTSGEEGLKDPLVRFGERYGRKEGISAERLRALFSGVSGLLGKRGYRVVSRDRDDGIFFTAASGRWRSPGTMLFHVGVLVITIGGVVGSFTGWRDMMFIRVGGVAPLARDSSLSIRVDDFAIEVTGRGEIKNFITTLSLLDSRGDTIAFGDVEVNHPMKVGARRIYQSEFTTEENEFRWARINYARRGGRERGSVVVVPGKRVQLGDSSVTLTAVRYIPDFRTSPDGPFSASSYPRNPALEVEVVSAGGAENGWLFRDHPGFNRHFLAPVDLDFAQCEPVYYTGLEVSANPGAPILFAGFALATLGLILMYLSNSRVLKGIASSEGIVLAGVESRWKTSFRNEFEEIRETMRKEMGKGGWSP